MIKECDRTFDESLLSGFVDCELTQADTQRVELHLETCGRCRLLVQDLKAVRQAARTTPFQAPDDDQWNEQPRSNTSRWLRRIGWGLITIWALGAVWMLAEELVASAMDWPEKLLLASLVAGGLALLLSVLLDRLKILGSDRYRRVQR